MKIAFFAIFSPIWSHILASPGPNMGFLKQDFNFQSFIERQHKLLYYNITNYDLSKNKSKNLFGYFWPKMVGKNLALILFKCGISCHFALAFNFHCFLLLNVFLHAKFENSPLMILPVSLFFHYTGPNLAQILPQRPHAFYFFWLISNKIC